MKLMFVSSFLKYESIMLDVDLKAAAQHKREHMGGAPSHPGSIPAYKLDSW